VCACVCVCLRTCVIRIMHATTFTHYINAHTYTLHARTLRIDTPKHTYTYAHIHIRTPTLYSHVHARMHLNSHIFHTSVQVPVVHTPYRNYSPVPVEVQTKSCVSTCYRPDYFIENTCREPVGFYRPVPGVLLHTVTGVSTCNRCRTDLYSLYRSV